MQVRRKLSRETLGKKTTSDQRARELQLVCRVEENSYKYDLPCCWDLLDNPMKKEHWKRLVNKKVNKFWSTRIKQSAELYPSLKYLTSDDYWPGQNHPLIQQVNGTRDIPRVNTRLKLVTGAYITQSNRAAFNHVPVDPTCMLCQQKPETIEHILTECKALEDTRRPILETFITECKKFLSTDEVEENVVQLILDPSRLIAKQNFKQGTWGSVDQNSKRLCQVLHLERYRRLALLPTRKEKRRNAKDRPQHT